VNVATIPQLSPFRYPGGKTWLIPEVRAWLLNLPQKPEILLEPFTGGGIVSLTAIAENLANRVIMVELDENVAAVWRVILEDGDWLASRILDFEVDLARVRQTLAAPASHLKERAFQTILRNRVQRGGIMAPGASLMKSGENGKGIASRWYPATLAKRIKYIFSQRERITFIHDDGLKVISQYLSDSNVAFFIDPPYTAGGKKAGKRLYPHSGLDHAALFGLMAKAKGNFLMTYDDAEEVENMAGNHGFYIRKVLMKNTHNRNMHELLIEKTSSS
jgi:DNA adenine methylase